MEKLAAGVQKLGLNLSPRQLEQFHIYFQELTDWNQRINLTSITGYDEVQVLHFLDSLTVTLVFKPSESGKGISVIDVGTGAGLPGIPMKILLPDINLVLLEATAKKAKFLNHLITRLDLDNIEVVVGRAEEVAHDASYRQRFKLVLSRAVGTLPALAELTLPFCAVGGIFVAQKKGTIDLELSRASEAITILGGNLREVKEVAMAEFDDRRWLVVIDKIKPTPHKYPRRPGIPVKRPLG